MNIINKKGEPQTNLFFRSISFPKSATLRSALTVFFASGGGANSFPEILVLRYSYVLLSCKKIT